MPNTVDKNPQRRVSPGPASSQRPGTAGLREGGQGAPMAEDGQPRWSHDIRGRGAALGSTHSAQGLYQVAMVVTALVLPRAGYHMPTPTWSSHEASQHPILQVGGRAGRNGAPDPHA